MNARDYLTLLRESKLTILGSVLVCLAIAGAVTLLLPRTYSATASYYVSAGTSTVGQQNPASDLYQGAQLAKDRVKSYSELVVGPRVAEDAVSRLGPGTTADSLESRIGVSSTDDTVLLTVSLTAGSPDQATRELTAVSDSFTDLVRQLEARPAAGGPQVDIQVVQPPTASTTPQSPKPVINILIGLLLGLVVGFGLAVFRRSADVAVRSADDLEYAADAPVLGVVPERAGGGPHLVPAVGAGAEAEAFRRVRTNVEFAHVATGRRVLVVTSALPGEGRTTATCNLAAALTAVGARVVVVDADLRQPGVLSLLDLEASAGLTEVVDGGSTVDAAVVTEPTSGFDVLGGGEIPARPNELLSSRRTHGLIKDLRDRYDYVLIDTPPLLRVADAVNLGTHADGAVIVCRWARTSGPEVNTAVAHLRAVSVPVVGAILNLAPARAEGRLGRKGGAHAATSTGQPGPDLRPIAPSRRPVAPRSEGLFAPVPGSRPAFGVQRAPGPRTGVVASGTATTAPGANGRGGQPVPANDGPVPPSSSAVRPTPAPRPHNPPEPVPATSSDSTDGRTV